MREKIVLAYSGGLDTTVAVRWLTGSRGFDVIALTVDLGSQPDLDAIRTAQARIAPYVHRTPVFSCRSLDAEVGARLFFKAENLQRTGAFKARGATNAVFSLSDAEARRGVVTHSSGNHGAALAYAAQRRGIPAYVVMPENSAKVKQDNIRRRGASIRFCAPTVAARETACAEVQRETRAHPDLKGWAMVGGWPLFGTSLLNDPSATRFKIVAVDALPAELAYVEKGVVPVLLAQPVYQWGYVGVQTIVDKVHFKAVVPQRIPMKVVRVTKENLKPWAQQLKDWGFAEVPAKYLK